MSKQVSLDKIRTTRFSNIRGSLSKEDIQEIVAQIKATEGVMQPVIVIGPDSRTGMYDLAFGFRRFRGSEAMGAKTIPVIVKKWTVAQVLKAQVIENLGRKPLNELEEARAFQRMKDELKLSQAQIAKHIGRTPGHVSQRLALLTKLAPETIDALDRGPDEGGIPFSAARDLSALSKKDQVATLKDAKKLRKIAEDAGKKDATKKPPSKPKIPGKGSRKAKTASRKAVKQAAASRKKGAGKAGKGSKASTLKGRFKKMRTSLSKEFSEGNNGWTANHDKFFGDVLGFLLKKNLLVLR